MNTLGIVVVFDNYSASLTNLGVRSVSEYVLSLLKILGMVIVGEKGTVASGTSTNGAIHKIPGLVSLVLKKVFCLSHFLC